MYAFFVLGLIPGTNIQITFTMWVDAIEFMIAVILAIYLFRRLSHERHLQAPIRSIFHAKQVHLRGV